MTYNILIEALAALARKGRIAGIDIVEINSMNDIGNGYNMAARVSSWILFEFFVRHPGERPVKLVRTAAERIPRIAEYG